LTEYAESPIESEPIRPVSKGKYAYLRAAVQATARVAGCLGLGLHAVASAEPTARLLLPPLPHFFFFFPSLAPL
jgi:hypothetical protein